MFTQQEISAATTQLVANQAVELVLLRGAVETKDRRIAELERALAEASGANGHKRRAGALPTEGGN